MMWRRGSFTRRSVGCSACRWHRRDWQQTTLNGAGRDAFIQLVRAPAEKRNAQAIAASVAATDPLLTLLDTHLVERPYMAGELVRAAGVSTGTTGPNGEPRPESRPRRIPTRGLRRGRPGRGAALYGQGG
ncbi:hypothetical protein [Sorangium sp. So ce887]|uniref:hypothetical protein n=1 Tax=Sorangium sp. So ce887 TaxID=3133324 RepID=UPI003F605B4C